MSSKGGMRKAGSSDRTSLQRRLQKASRSTEIDDLLQRIEDEGKEICSAIHRKTKARCTVVLERHGEDHKGIHPKFKNNLVTWPVREGK